MGRKTRGPVADEPSRPAVAARRRAALRLLDEWLSDRSGYDEETWPALKQSLEADRASSRRLFGD